jgi:hypothetical protein
VPRKPAAGSVLRLGISKDLMMLRRQIGPTVLAIALSLCARPVGATEPDPDSSQADVPAPPWLLRAGFLSRSLLLSLERDGAHRLSYWPNHTKLLSFTGGYRGLVLGFSLSAGRSEPVETHGASSGFDLRASFPLEVVAMLTDSSAHQVLVRGMGVTWMPIQVMFVFGLRF